MSKSKKRRALESKQSKPTKSGHRNSKQQRAPSLANSKHANPTSFSSKQKPKPHLVGPGSVVTSLQQQQQQQHTKPTIPFSPYDRILLVGEGDFSFSRSLVAEHGCADITATCFDSREELLEKYPQSASHIRYIEGEGQKVLYGVDATKLAQKELKAGEGYERVLFNFPHTGGKSTDVNRQVRYNQALLVGFLNACKPLLATGRQADYHTGVEGLGGEGGGGGAAPTVIVTLFEGEPYTLWNVRDLARHCGYVVRTSFRFQAGAYPGYRHARTIGNIVSKKARAEIGQGDVGKEKEEDGEEDGGKNAEDGLEELPERGGWKGEERPARSYVFELRREDAQAKGGAQKKRKRKEEDSDQED
ncbi:hypothetical protein LTS18_001325 [Coniosporium uncinatum]|uniref:Uncharacterized protein n=1 Tax=Coniosporium uncinatum TaxID=93489 RepID=A0ACC3D7Z9_9PEZI|nr:hypothetical protein LTS18_001325 [Coniosporium uncinatum]